MARISHYELAYSAQSASGTITGFHVGDYRNVVVTISTASSFAGTIKFQGAIRKTGDQKTIVDFSDGVNVNDGTTTNPWMYIQCIDLENATAFDGDTGVVYSGTDGIRIVELNTNSFEYFGIHFTAITAGTATVVCHFTDNS